MNIKPLFYRQEQVRLVWPLLLMIVLIMLGEMILVDPIGLFVTWLGFPDSPHAVEHEWSLVANDVIKRSIRSIVILLSLWVPLRFVMKQSFHSTGYKFQKWTAAQLALGIALGFIVQLIPLLLMSLAGWYSMEGWLWDFKPFVAIFPALVFSFIYSTETAIIEESIFRGFLMNSLNSRYNVKVGLISSSLVFGLLHFSGASNEFPWWLSLISATAGGFVFGQAYLLYGNIWTPLGIHFGVHFSARTLGTVGLSADEATLLVTHVDGPVMLVVTKAGGASLFELLGYGVVSIVMVIIRRRRILHSAP